MKKIFKKMLAVMLVPSFLFVSGCDLLKMNNDEDETQEVSETQDEMFTKYISAVAKTKSSTEYTIIASTEDFEDSAKEITVTKKDNEFHYTDRQGTEWSKVSRVKIDDDYIHYTDNSWDGKASSYITEYDFNSASELLSSVKFTEFRTIAGLKDFFKEYTIKYMTDTLTSEDFSNIEETFKIEKVNGEYVLTASVKAILDVESQNAPEVDIESLSFTYIVKVHFGEKINRIYGEFVLDATVDGEEECYKMIEDQRITYQFDSTLATTDFSSYPTPTN